MFHYLVYVSTATRRMSTPELHGLLDEFRPLNAAADVTGALLYRDGTFMQALEGEESAVEAVYARVCRDRRHYDVTLIIDGETTTRQFADWSMAFRDLTSDASDVAHGFSQFMHGKSNDTYGLSPTIAQRVLMSFRHSLATVT